MFYHIRYSIGVTEIAIMCVCWLHLFLMVSLFILYAHKSFSVLYRRCRVMIWKEHGLNRLKKVSSNPNARFNQPFLLVNYLLSLGLLPGLCNWKGYYFWRPTSKGYERVVLFLNFVLETFFYRLCPKSKHCLKQSILETWISLTSRCIYISFA